SRWIIDRRLLETVRLQLHDPPLRELDHVLLRAEVEATGRAGLDAGGLETDRDAVDAERALGHLPGGLREAGHVEGTAGLAVLAADALIRVDVDDAVGVLDDRARRGACGETSRLVAMHALVLAHQPDDASVEVALVESDQVPVL